MGGTAAITFGYDADSRLTQAGALSLTRDPQTAFLTGTTLGHVADTRSYSTFGELSRYQATVGGVPVFAAQYTRDALGRITRKTETVQGVTSTIDYAYDPAGRLREVRTNSNLMAECAHDANGNRLSRMTASGTVTGSYDARDRLLTYGAATYTYTATGELRNYSVALRRRRDIVTCNQEVADMSDRIVKVVELKASVSRVWRALTDHREFGQWFRVNLDGPFKPGAMSTGRMTYPGYEHYRWLALVERMDHETLFSFRWHDFDEKSGVDISKQPATLVEFHLEAIPPGTRLTIVESGFAALPGPRRLEVLRGNTEGWNIQADNIAAHVAPSA